MAHIFNFNLWIKRAPKKEIPPNTVNNIKIYKPDVGHKWFNIDLMYDDVLVRTMRVDPDFDSADTLSLDFRKTFSLELTESNDHS